MILKFKQIRHESYFLEWNIQSNLSFNAHRVEFWFYLMKIVTALCVYSLLVFGQITHDHSLSANAFADYHSWVPASSRPWAIAEFGNLFGERLTSADLAWS